MKDSYSRSHSIMQIRCWQGECGHCTQILIIQFGVDCVLFTGVAGALDPKLNIGDIVISTDCIQHDIDVSALRLRTRHNSLCGYFGIRR